MKTYLLVVVTILIIGSPSVYSQWKPINNGLNGGAVTALLENKGVLYAGCAYGGLYVSKDSATTWKPIGTTLPTSRISCIAVSNGNLIIISGISTYYSTDEGKNWKLSDSGNISIKCMSVKGDTVYASTWKNVGVFISTNKGVSWSLCSNQGLTSLDVRAIGVYKNKLFAATYGGGMFMSTDFGEHWVERNNGILDNKLVSVSVSGDTLFSSVYRGESYFSSDEGETWNRLYNLPINYGVEKVIKYPIGLIGITSTSILLSVDSGATWKGIIPYGYFLSYISCIQVGSKVIMASGDLNGASIYYTLDTGKTLVECNKGMQNATMLSLAKGNGILYTGTLGNSIYRSSDNGILWEPTNRIWGMDNVNQLLAHGDTIFAGTQYRGLYVSYDKGDTWQKTGNFFALGVGVTSLYENNNVIYVSTNRSGDGLYSTTDFGKSWTEKKNGFIDNIGIQTIYAQGDTILVGFYNGVYRSTNKGDTWVLKNNGLVKAPVKSILRNGNEIWVATDSLGILRSTDWGDTWTFKNNGISNPWVQTITRSGSVMIARSQNTSSRQNGIWVPFYGAVFASLNNGEKWVNITANLPSTDVTFGTIDGTTLYAGLRGLGLYTANLADFNLSSAEQDAVAQNNTLVFPNPCTNNITIQTNNTQSLSTIRIFDILGNCVYVNTAQLTGLAITIDTSTLPKGSYTLQVGLQYSRFIKM